MGGNSDGGSQLRPGDGSAHPLAVGSVRSGNGVAAAVFTRR